MKRATRIVVYALAGFATGLVVAVLAIVALTRTERGQTIVRDFVIKQVEKDIEGSLTIERVGGGGLLGGAKLYKIALRDTTGRPMIEADSAEITYRWRDFFRGRIRLSSIEVFHPRVVLEQLPGDTAWNYERIFIDKDTTTSDRRLIELNNIEIHDGFLTIREPLDTSKPIEVGDTARNVIERVNGGLVGVMHFDSVNARLSRVLWESPIEDGRFFDATSVSGVAFVWKEPLRISQLAGRVTVVDTVISFDLKPVEFGGSKANVLGRVVQEEGRNVVDVDIQGQRLQFQDLKWLYPKLPEKGFANLRLRIQTQPRGTLWYASNARISAPGTNLRGNFGIVTGDTTYFTDVDLEASPMNLELLEQVLPAKLPVQGLMVGTVKLKGPISQLDTKGDIQIVPTGSGTPSSVRWEGTFDARSHLATSNFNADIRDFDLAVLNALKPEMNLKGFIRGKVQLSGGFAEQLRFAGEIQHELAGWSSHFAGTGSYDVRSRELDLALEALPLSIEELARSYPALQKLRGEARGPIRFRGPTDNLNVEARLATGGGQLDFNGVLQLRDGRRRYSGQGRLSGFQLDGLVNDLPNTNVSGNIQFDLTGTSTEDANGVIAVRLDRSRVAGVALHDVKVDARMRGGLLALDSARANSWLGQVTANGEFGIAPGRQGTVRLAIHSDSIAPLNESKLVTGGELDASGTLRGGIHGFDLSAEATLARALFDRANAQRATVRIEGSGLATDSGSLRVALAADTAVLYGQRMDSLRADLVYRASGGSLTFGAGSVERTYRMISDLHADSGALTFGIREAAGGLRGMPWVLQSPVAVRVGSTGLQADTFAFRQTNGRGSALGAGRLAWARSAADSGTTGKQPLDFSLALRSVPLAEYLRIFRTNATSNGSIDANIAIGGTAIDPIINADAAFIDLRYGDARIDRLAGTFVYNDHRINVRVQGRQGDRELVFGDGNIPVDLAFMPLPARKLNQPLEFSLRADSMPASLMVGFVPGFRDVTGTVSGTLDLRGTTRDPTIAGLLTLRDAAGTLDASGVRYRDVDGTFRVLNDTVVAIEATAWAGDRGWAALVGNMVFAPLGNPRFENVVIDATRFPAANRREAVFTTSGRLVLKGTFKEPELSGSITVDNGALYLDELYRQTQIVQLDPSNPLFYTVIDTSLTSVKSVLPGSTSPFVHNLAVSNLTVDVGRDVWLRGRNLDAAVTGRLQVTLDAPPDPSAPRTIEDLKLAGELTAERGTYRMEYRPFGVRRFEIRDGTVRFAGTPGLDPYLDFTTVYRARPMSATAQEPFDILAMVSGTLLSPTFRLTTEESAQRSESDLYSYLFFGVPTSQLSSAQSRSLADATGPGQNRAVQFGVNYAKTSLFDYLALGVQNFFQDYDLLDYVSFTAVDAQNPESLGSFVSDLKNNRLEIGRYFPSPYNMFLIFSRRQDAISPTKYGARVEWRVRPTYTVELFAEDRFARGQRFGIENTNAFPTVYGFFLFREWSY